MISITQLEYLLALDKEKHFKKAASECNVSQPSLSTQIQKMEEELGVVIFDRSKKPILTTEIGLIIIEQAKKVISEHKKIATLATLGAKEPRGDFNLAVIPTLAPYLIPLFIGSFSKKYPKVNLQINEYETRDIIKLLVNDELDAGLLVTPLRDDRIIERHLFFEPFYAYVSKDHQLAKKKILSEKDLEDNSLWLLKDGHCFIAFASGNLETLKNLVKKNSGYTLLPELAKLELSDIEMKEHIKKLKKPTPTREVSIAHSRDFLKETIIQALEDEILLHLPAKIKSFKRQDIEVIDIY